MNWRKYSNSPIARNAAVLFIGSASSQVIAMAANLGLSQVYEPEQFGALGIFISLTAFVSVVASARFDQAIMLPAERADASDLAVASILLGCATAVGVLVMVAPFQIALLDALGAPALAGWILLLPLSIAAAAVIQAMTIWTTRQQRFATVSAMRIGQSAASAMAQLAGGTYHFAGGLIGGSIGGQAVAVTAYGAAIARDEALRFSRPRWRGIPALLRRYRDMPLHSVPESMLAQAQVILPSLAVARLFTLETAGHLMLAQRLTLLPVAFVTQALGQVMFQRMAAKHAVEGDLRVPLRFIWSKLGMVALPLAVMTWLYAEQAVTLVLGPKWSECGRIVETMAPYLAVVLTFGPTSSIAIVLRKQHVSLAVAVVALVAKLGAILACILVDADYLWMIRAFVAIDSLQIIGLNAWFYRQLGANRGKA